MYSSSLQEWLAGMVSSHLRGGNMKKSTLAELSVLRRHWGQAERRASTDLVFCKADGHPWNPDVLRKDVLYPVLDRLRLPRPARSSGFHRFRHSAGSFVNSQTGNLKLAQRMLGHSRFETTANVYTHALEDQEREAALAVEQAIFGESAPISVPAREQRW